MMNNRLKKILVMVVLGVFVMAICPVGGAMASADSPSGSPPTSSGDPAIGSSAANSTGGAGANQNVKDEDKNGDRDENEDEDTEEIKNEEAYGGEDQDENEDLELDLDEQQNDEEQNQETEKAAEKLARAIEKLSRNPGDAAAYEDLARAYAALGQWDKVAEAANQLLALEPDNEDARVLLAASMYRQGDKEGALQLLQTMAQKEASDDDVYEMLGELLESQGELEEALEKYEKAAVLNPDDPDIFKRLGKTYQKLNREGVKVFVNGKKPALDVQPQIREGRTLVPFRALAESLGAQVSWDGNNRQVAVIRAHIRIQLSVGSPEATVNGTPVTLDVPATIVDGRVMVPLRFISEGLRARVTWDPSSQMVVVKQ